jgi:hypothetical protein
VLALLLLLFNVWLLAMLQAVNAAVGMGAADEDQNQSGHDSKLCIKAEERTERSPQACPSKWDY